MDDPGQCDSGCRGASPAAPELAGCPLRVFCCFISLPWRFLSALGWCIWVYVQIEHYAYEDQAAPADVICVFGAAEYAGRPSPVLRARLDHALALYEHGIAPVVLTLGGSAPGDAFSEGQVGQAYLDGQRRSREGDYRRNAEPQYGGAGGASWPLRAPTATSAWLL
jgi:hypothetical protein